MVSWRRADSGLLGQWVADWADPIRPFEEWETASVLGEGTPGSRNAGARSLFQLVCESEATVPMSEEDLRGLLRKAQLKHEGIGIPGRLLRAEGRVCRCSRARKRTSSASTPPFETIRGTRISERSTPRQLRGRPSSSGRWDSET